MIHRILILILILFSPFFTNAKTNLDSLYSVWRDEAKADSFRVQAYQLYIFYGYLYPKPDSAIVLAEELRAYCKKRDYLKGEAYALTLLGQAYFAKADYSRAKEYHLQSIVIFEEIGNEKGIASELQSLGNVENYSGNTQEAISCYNRALKIYQNVKNSDDVNVQDQMARILFNMGYAYYKLSNMSKALDYFKRSLKISGEIKSNMLIASGLNIIGGINSEQKNYPKALDYLNRALTLFEEIDDKRNVAACLTNLGSVYKEQGNFAKALDFYNRALVIHNEMADKRNISDVLNSIGILYKDQKSYVKALEFFNRALEIKKEIGDRFGISKAKTDIGTVYLEQSNFTKAIEYCNEGLGLAEELGMLDYQLSGCNCLYSAYKAIGEGNKALVFMEKIRVVEDSLNEAETGQKLQQIEFEKKLLADSIANAEKERLTQEAHYEEVRQKNKTKNIALGVGIILLILSGGLYGRVRYIRKSKAVLQTEKDRSENLLLNILPADIAAELKEKGKADARDFDLVSIIFTDFKSFTQASEKLTAAELVNEINTCFEAFDDIMEKYGIEKIKTIGDAYMAAGGLPIPKDESVKNTILAALDMQAFITARSAQLEAIGEQSFTMRAGVHTGPVVAGIVGVKKFQYDIWGDTVNTASRMESASEVGKVNISQTTYLLLKDDPDFVFENRGKIEAKGKGEIEMYFVSKA